MSWETAKQSRALPLVCADFSEVVTAQHNRSESFVEKEEEDENIFLFCVFVYR